TDPFDTDTLQLLETRCGARIVPVLATREDILEGVKQHYLRGMPARNEAPRVLLVVDDSTEITSEIAQALSKEGYQMLMANDGVQGLTIAFSQRPDLILCDATLPRMDGYALMRAVKANPATAGTPIILLTAKVSPEEEHRALKSGFQDFIAKPMMTVRVVARVKRAFDLMHHNRQQQAVPAA
ncbi:response regulator, partial [Geomonas sp.]|uniref:response regulator n=1 Tax=Geomonas sp. TaxID=2651584 RepID=UPI002B493975